MQLLDTVSLCARRSFALFVVCCKTSTECPELLVCYFLSQSGSLSPNVTVPAADSELGQHLLLM